MMNPNCLSRYSQIFNPDELVYLFRITFTSVTVFICLYSRKGPQSNRELMQIRSQNSQNKPRGKDIMPHECWKGLLAPKGET